jgi:hypothetical protein
MKDLVYSETLERNFASSVHEVASLLLLIKVRNIYI